MTQLVIRNLDEGVKARLQRRAKRLGHSIEEEARDILRDAVRAEGRAATPLGSRLRRRFARIGLDMDIPELRGHKPTPMGR
jgi:plasmid stability protein